MNSVGGFFLIPFLLGSLATAASAQAVDEAIAYLVLEIEDGQQRNGHEVKRSSEGEYDLISSDGEAKKLIIKEIQKCKFKIAAEPKQFREKDLLGKRHKYYLYAIFDLTKYSLQGPDLGIYTLTGNAIRCTQAADENNLDIDGSLQCEGKIRLPELGVRPLDEDKYRKAMSYLTSNFCKPRAF
jgi:hypothetical protein